MGDVQTWKFDDPKTPKLTNITIVKKAVLQVTDIKTNRNKYYAIELHQAGQRSDVGTASSPTTAAPTTWRRTPTPARRSAATSTTQWEAEALLRLDLPPEDRRRRRATRRSPWPRARSARRRRAARAPARSTRRRSSGSPRPRPAGDGGRDARAAGEQAPTPACRSSSRYIYDEAKSALTSTVAAKITANGIETPLGILTLGQIEKGETILDRAVRALPGEEGKQRDDEMHRLSGEFYTAIPHRIGRTRAAVEAAVINSLEAFEQKQRPCSS